MKIFALLFWFASAVCRILIKERSENENALSLAFENVTKHLFQLETRMFINNYGVDSDTMTWLLLESLNKKGMPFKLQNIEFEYQDIVFSIFPKKIFIDSSAFVTFDLIEKLRKFNMRLDLTNEFYKPIQLFVYCQRATIKDIKSLAKDVSGRHPKANIPECGPDLKLIPHCYFQEDLQDSTLR